jgi:hypothetical protein
METMDAIQDALGPKIDQEKLLGIIAILEHSGPEVGFEQIAIDLFQARLACCLSVGTRRP